MLVKMAYTIVTLPPREVYEVQCHRCGHVWLYTGRNRHYAQCSNCRTTVTLHSKEEVTDRSIIDKEHYLNSEAICQPQTGPIRATNSEDQNAAITDTTTLERDYTEHG